MTWTIKNRGSWGEATTSAPGSELATVLALPGSWAWYPYGNTALVRKDQWGSLLSVPHVDSITPVSGPAAGGTPATLVGAGLIGSTAVSFGGTAGTGFTLNGDGSISCVTPAHAVGAVNVVVTNPRGNVTVTNGYTYV